MTVAVWASGRASAQPAGFLASRRRARLPEMVAVPKRPAGEETVRMPRTAVSGSTPTVAISSPRAQTGNLPSSMAHKLPSSRSTRAVTRRGMAKRVPNFIAWTWPRNTRSLPEMPVGKPM